ncbi:GntR family transcriptional repressor for pyruvate dehydrogenase complex [Pararhizobium capsulatum DSM 1112]|uniref:GntR family transcriptional repressor for pyruvate dehydrogenase complex n=1 Tax=Pararhizobium capsulatum DSM 1112 TaxID=1121113 RepID=A0ABU0BWJ1_9HYPH|nr:FadR/GntR family transcriptional regulator [Pararhizobium capsulatum]MDQ0322631.1 GntR family transcriptional repressor for pyruvate dehydrogenase complex [Pararhizobium capsulatum DSM 1112]
MVEEGASLNVETARNGKPGRAVKLVDRVFDQLMDRIRAGNYPPDSRLPGEHELSSMLGVSRPIVRDALARLREQGVVYARQGAGTFVSAQGTPSAHLAYSPVKTIADIQRCYEFRLTIEPAAAFFAAKRRDETAIQKIAVALSDLREATNHHLHKADADFAFHRAVTEAANNHYYTASLDALKAHIAVGMHLHGLSLLGPRQGLQQVFEEHDEIYRAVAEGRAQEARDLMHRHLEGSRDRLFEGRALDLSF